MFLDTFKNTDSRQNEVSTEKLTEMLDKKQSELDSKERQIQHLSKNLRKWTRKYHELELSISENIIESAEDESATEEEEAKRLKMMLIELNKRNARLEKRLAKVNNFIDNLEDEEKSKVTEESNVTKKTVTKETNPDAIVIEVTKSPEKSTDEFSQNDIEEEEVELEFSAQMQATLQKHAKIASHA